MELADHKNVTINTGPDVYFADPRSPWQRGTNENANRLLRQHLQKGVGMAQLTQDDLDAGARADRGDPRRSSAAGRGGGIANLLVDRPTAGRIGVSLLGHDHAAVAYQLASRKGDRFAGLGTRVSDLGALFIEESVLWLDCEIASETPAGEDRDVAGRRRVQLRPPVLDDGQRQGVEAGARGAEDEVA